MIVWVQVSCFVFFNQLLEMLISNRSWLIDFALLFLVGIFIKSEGFFFTQMKKKTFVHLIKRLLSGPEIQQVGSFIKEPINHMHVDNIQNKPSIFFLF